MMDITIVSETYNGTNKLDNYKPSFCHAPLPFSPKNSYDYFFIQFILIKKKKQKTNECEIDNTYSNLNKTPNNLPVSDNLSVSAQVQNAIFCFTNHTLLTSNNT